MSLWSLPGPFQNNVEPCAELADLALPLSCPCPLRSSPAPLPDEARPLRVHQPSANAPAAGVLDAS